MPKLQRGSFRKDRRRGNKPIVPTIMLSSGQRQVYIQNGHVFGAGGSHIPNPPDWVMDQLTEWAKADKAMLDRLGFEMKFGKLKPKPNGATPAVAKPSTKPAPQLDDGDDLLDHTGDNQEAAEGTSAD